MKYLPIIIFILSISGCTKETTKETTKQTVNYENFKVEIKQEVQIIQSVVNCDAFHSNLIQMITKAEYKGLSYEHYTYCFDPKEFNKFVLQEKELAEKTLLKLDSLNNLLK